VLIVRRRRGCQPSVNLVSIAKDDLVPQLNYPSLCRLTTCVYSRFGKGFRRRLDSVLGRLDVR
jgi:hypothetical protein